MFEDVSWWTIPVAYLLGSFVTAADLALRERRKKRKWWHCPENKCGFSAYSSDPGSFDRVKFLHLETHAHRE